MTGEETAESARFNRVSFVVLDLGETSQQWSAGALQKPPQERQVQRKQRRPRRDIGPPSTGHAAAGSPGGLSHDDVDAHGHEDVSFGQPRPRCRRRPGRSLKLERPRPDADVLPC